MTRIRLGPLDPPQGTVRVPGDKSIGHRAVILAAPGRSPGELVDVRITRSTSATLFGELA